MNNDEEAKSQARCAFVPCPGENTWRPELLLVSKRDGLILRAKVDLELCQMHKEQSAIDDILSPEGWDRITKHLRESGKGEFVKKQTEIEWSLNPDAERPLPF